MTQKIGRSKDKFSPKTKSFPFKVRKTGMIKRFIYCSNSKAKPIRSEAVSNQDQDRAYL